MQKTDDGEYSAAALSPTRYKLDQSGWYAQAVYQPIPARERPPSLQFHGGLGQ
jgi:hypothetical protein